MFIILGLGAPVRQAPPRLPPYRAAAGGGADQPDLDQWRKAGYNVIWRREVCLPGIRSFESTKITVKFEVSEGLVDQKRF